MKRIGSIIGGFALAFAALSLNGQNVGIGTANPLSKLHISSAASADGILIDNTGGNGDPILQFGVDGHSIHSMGIDDSDADKFKIGTSAITSNTRLTIQTNGYIGIGTTTPAYHLHVTGFKDHEYLAYFHNTSNLGSSILGYTSGTFNAVGGVTENSSGLGIYGVHLPASGYGTGIKGESYSSDGIGVHGCVPTIGAHQGYGGYFTGGIGYRDGLWSLSDGRVKKNVETLHGALDLVMQLRGVSYQYNTEEYGKYVGTSDRTFTGFIAQEVEKVVPTAVADKYIVTTTDANGMSMDMQSVERQMVKVVDYVSLVPVLVEAMKEQQAEIQRLQKKIEELEAQH
jgi:hypothetical protein